LHAIADALLGAAGLRDIGYYFPNTDPNIKNIKSSLIVQKALEELKNSVGG
jgi:2-C-methyl-D-erythritol 2,4-cyclodiphosphate synthase